MTTAATPRVSSHDHLAHERQVQQCLHALQARGWEQRLAPLAQHMAQQHLVRGRGYAGVPLRRLDVEVLRTALSQMLSQDWEEASLILQLVVDGMNSAQIAAERGVSQPVLVDQLRDAVDELAIVYEDTAYASVDGSYREQVRAALARAAKARSPGARTGMAAAGTAGLRPGLGHRVVRQRSLHALATRSCTC
jgi:hypothetical protein